MKHFEECQNDTNLRTFLEESERLDQLLLTKKNAEVMLSCSGLDEKSKLEFEKTIETITPLIKEIQEIVNQVSDRIKRFLTYKDR